MINISEELKSRITIEDVVAQYWEEPDRAHRVKCFAHGDFVMFIDADDCLNGQHALWRRKV